MFLVVLNPKENACVNTKSCSFLFPLGFPVSSLSCPHFSAFSSPLIFFFCLPLPLFFLLLSKTIKVKIIDDEEYEKNKTFYIEIGDPRLVESNDTKGQKGGEPCDLVNFDPGVFATVCTEAACSRGGA